MTADSVRPTGLQSVPGSGGVLTRSELIAAERARRAAVKVRREIRGDQAVDTAMSQAERSQRTLLNSHLADVVRHFIARVEHRERLAALSSALDISLAAILDAESVRAGWRRSTWGDALRLVRETGRSAGPILVALADHGVAELPPARLDPLRDIAAGHLGVSDNDRTDAWKTARGLTTLLQGASPASGDLVAMARSADLPVVDSALDREPALVTEVRARATSAERDYLTARTRPQLLDAEALERLGWEDEIRRRAFVAGVVPEGDDDDDPWVVRRRLLDGDMTAVPAARTALPELRDVLDDLSTPGDLVARHGTDPSLWRLLDAALGPDLGTTGLHPFDVWRNLSRARTALHTDDLGAATTHLGQALRSRPSEATLTEAHNMALYCAIVLGETSKARTHLKALDRAAALPRVARNLDLARSTLLRIEGGDRRSALDRFESPWVALGLDEPTGPDDDRAWDAQWIHLQKVTRTDTKRRIRVNRARQRLAKGEDPGTHFVTPLVATHFTPPSRGILFPGPTPLPRRTAPPDADDIRRRTALAWNEATVCALDEARPTELWQELHDDRP